MEVKNIPKQIVEKLSAIVGRVKGRFFRQSEHSRKLDIDFRALRVLGAITVLIFVIVVFLMPNDAPIEFTEKIVRSTATDDETKQSLTKASRENSAEHLWGSPKMDLPGGMGGSQINYDTPMVLGPKGGNAKTELRAGIRLPLRILDKVVVSQESVPILAELILNSESESGLKLQAGTKFYGEASFQKGSSRATVRFSQISLPSGQIRKISALAIGKDGQPGVSGRTFSDGMKNTVGQVLTTFVGGLAAGSMQTDVLGRSKGGIENGLLGAVSATAQSRAQAYGEKLKTEREWIELGAGVECDAVLSDSLKLQEGGESYE